jgi:enediyne biosynthesis protein E7
MSRTNPFQPVSSTVTEAARPRWARCLLAVCSGRQTGAWSTARESCGSFPFVDILATVLAGTYIDSVVLASARASLMNARAYEKNPIAFYQGLSGNGDGYRTFAPFDLFGQNVLINDPDLVADVLASPSGQRFGKTGLRFFTVIRRMLGSGLFGIDGDQHQRRRRLVYPLLRGDALGPAADAMSRAAERLREEWASPPGRTVDVAEVAARISLELLAEALAGPPLAAPVLELGHLFTQTEPALLRVLKAPVVFPAWLPTPGNRRLGRATAALRDRAADLLRLDEPAPDTILGRLLAREPDRTRVLDELVTLVVAGHHSTAAAIAFTLYLLAQHPDEAERVAEEATAVLNGRAATIEDLPALPHTAMVVAEAMRLFPPVWIITRRSIGRQRLGDHDLKAGTTVHICPHTLHRNPAHWPEPDRFQPGRFDGTSHRHRFAYAPFGGGPHKCVGNDFALMATAIVIATVVPAVRLHPPAQEVRVSARSFTVPQGGLPLRLTPTPH